MFNNYEWLFQSFPEDEYQRTDDEVCQLTIDGLINDKFEQIEPVFNRDGWYYDRLANHSWYEWKGTAWKAEVDQFKYELGQHDARILEPAEVKAIKTLIVYGSCNLELRQLLWDHDNKIMTRDTFRNTQMFVRRELNKMTDPATIADEKETETLQWLEEIRDGQPTDCG